MEPYQGVRSRVRVGMQSRRDSVLCWLASNAGKSMGNCKTASLIHHQYERNQFITRVEENQIKKKFTLKDMVFDGELIL
jgi:hypothetical protein